MNAPQSGFRPANVWKTIPSFPTHEASDDGRIRHARKLNELRQRPTWNGYLTVCIRGSRMVSRLVCEAFHGPAPSPEHQAAHRNGKKTENNEGNLDWLTRPENYEDQVLHGTHRKGVLHPLARFTEEDVKKIRLLALSKPQDEIAAQFGITQGQVSTIVNRKQWAHV